MRFYDPIHEAATALAPPPLREPCSRAPTGSARGRPPSGAARPVATSPQPSAVPGRRARVSLLAARPRVWPACRCSPSSASRQPITHLDADHRNAPPPTASDRADPAASLLVAERTGRHRPMSSRTAAACSPGRSSSMPTATARRSASPPQRQQRRVGIVGTRSATSSRVPCSPSINDHAAGLVAQPVTRSPTATTPARRQRRDAVDAHRLARPAGRAASSTAVNVTPSMSSAEATLPGPAGGVAPCPEDHQAEPMLVMPTTSMARFPPKARTPHAAPQGTVEQRPCRRAGIAVGAPPAAQPTATMLLFGQSGDVQQRPLAVRRDRFKGTVPSCRSCPPDGRSLSSPSAPRDGLPARRRSARAPPPRRPRRQSVRPPWTCRPGPGAAGARGGQAAVSRG